MQNDTSPSEIALLAQILEGCGYTRVQVDEMVRKFNLTLNAAIIDDVLARLTSEENKALKDKLMKEPKTTDIVKQSLENACSQSTNHVDFESLVKTTLIRVIDSFWADLEKKMTDTQREKLNTALDQLISQSQYNQLVNKYRNVLD